MCRMCEGTSREQLLDEARCHIIHHGWFLQGIVPGPDGGGGWVYTVGLLENFDHPELVVADISYEDGGALLNDLGEFVRQGHDLRRLPKSKTGLATIRAVHPRHFDHDLVNTYIALESRMPLAGDYLQVVPDRYCSAHLGRLTDLSDPNQLLD